MHLPPHLSKERSVALTAAPWRAELREVGEDSSRVSAHAVFCFAVLGCPGSTVSPVHDIEGRQSTA